MSVAPKPQPPAPKAPKKAAPKVEKPKVVKTEKVKSDKPFVLQPRLTSRPFKGHPGLEDLRKHLGK